MYRIGRILYFGYFYLSDNNFISYGLPFGYTWFLFLATRPDGTNKYVSSGLLCLLHEQGRCFLL